MSFSPSEWHLSEGEDRARLFTVVYGGRMRSNRFKPKQERFTVDLRGSSLPTWTGRQRNRLSRGDVQPLLLETFKPQLDKAQSSLIWPQSCPRCEQESRLGISWSIHICHWIKTQKDRLFWNRVRPKQIALSPPFHMNQHLTYGQNKSLQCL